MKPSFVPTTIAAASLMLAACAHPLNTALPADKETPMTQQQQDDAALRARLNFQPVAWPLKFKRHSFGAWCYDTQYCSVWYGGMESGRNTPSPPSSKYGPGYLDHWRGGYSVDNFPPPADVTWRSKDGTEHKTAIDIGALFRDELVRHNVPREEIREVPDGKLGTNPGILVEVNDRTIRVYMRARIPTKHMQIPGNQYSDFRHDLILVQTTHY